MAQQISLMVIGIVGIIVSAFYISRVRKGKRRPQKTSSPAAQGSLWNRILAPLSGSRQREYQHASEDDSAELHTTQRDVEQAPTNPTVDRNTSFRSVLTLPAYSQRASNSEQVIAREGDRDGMDVVVDLPTEEENEARREEEMAALYQLRSTRREQHQERAELRRLREQARRDGDFNALVMAQVRTQAATEDHGATVEELRREIERAKENNRQRASSVSYADLGVARHDGTRIRANSQESERTGLLSDAANMGQRSRSRADSSMSHSRDISASSAVSLVSDLPSPDLTGSHPAGSEGPLAGSSPELVGSDLGVEPMPPPDYEDVPLEEGGAHRSTTPSDEPPPDYPGPYRSASVRSQHNQASAETAQTPASNTEGGRAQGRGVGGVPQLPSLRIRHLPEIVVEPSSAHPRDGDNDGQRPTST